MGSCGIRWRWNGLKRECRVGDVLGGDEKACVTIYSSFQRDVIYPTK